MGYLTRLDAINEMLLAAGESLVSDLDESSGVDTSIAEWMLDNVATDYQFRGLAHNTYIQKKKPDSNNKIFLPNDAINITLLSGHTSNNTADGFDGYTIEAGIRGEPNGYLFNITEQTDQWDAGTEYTVEIIQRIRWEDMDSSIQKAVVAGASRWYQMITQGDEAADAFLAQKEAMGLAEGKASDAKTKGRSIFDGDLSRRAIRREHFLFNNDPARFRFWRAKM